jgi:quercetin dioxygenase-like cupin family protein
VCKLRDNGAGGGAALVRVAAGARVPTHDHPGGEEVLLIQGRAVVGGVTLNAGDYLWTAPGEAHDLRAEEDTVLFVTTPNGVRVIERRAPGGRPARARPPAPGSRPRGTRSSTSS